MADFSNWTDAELEAIAKQGGNKQTALPAQQLGSGANPANYTDAQLEEIAKRGNSGSRRLLLDTVKRMVSMPSFLSAQPGYTLPEDLSNRNPALSISDNEAEALLRIGANVETGPLKLVPNLANAAERLIRYGIRNEDQPIIPSGQQVLSAGLSRSGINPEPANQAERYGTIAGEVLTGAGVAGAAGLPGLAARPLTQMAGAMTGTAASDLVRTQFPNAPAWVAPAVGIATGIATGIAAPIFTGAAKTGKAVLYDYQSEAGRKAAAGRMLNRFSTAPTEVPARIQRLKDAGKIEIIPGSNPLLSEVAQDEGLAVLTRVLPTTQAGIETGAISIRGNRMAQSDAAIRNLADRQFGTKNGGFNDELWNDVSNQQSALNAALRKQYNLDNVQVDVAPVVDFIGKLKQRYAGKEKITGMLESLESQLSKEAKLYGSVSKIPADQLPEYVDNAYQRAFAKYPDQAEAIFSNIDTSAKGIVSQQKGYAALEKLADSPVGVVLGKRPDTGLTLSQAAAKLGGIDIRYMADAIGESKLSATVRQGMPANLFRKGGRSPDEMAQALRDAGYLTERQFADMDGVKFMLGAVGDEIAGRRFYYRPQDIGNSQAALEYDRAFEIATSAKQPSKLPLPESSVASAQFLWNARQNLDDLIYESALTSTKGSAQEMGKVGEIVRRVYNSAITAKMPEFKPYLDEWAKLQRTKDRMTYGAELISGASNSSRNVLTQELRDADALYGEASITPAKYEQRLSSLKGKKREFNKLSPEQKETTGQVADELRRRSFLDTGGLVRGSDTAQKLNANTLLQNDLMYSIFGPQYQRSIAANMLGSGLNKPLNWLTGTAVEDIMQQVQRGLIDPEYGALLMRETAIPKPMSLGSLMSSGGAGGRASLLFGR